MLNVTHALCVFACAKIRHVLICTMQHDARCVHCTGSKTNLRRNPSAPPPGPLAAAGEHLRGVVGPVVGHPADAVDVGQPGPDPVAEREGVVAAVVAVFPVDRDRI